MNPNSLGGHRDVAGCDPAPPRPSARSPAWATRTLRTGRPWPLLARGEPARGAGPGRPVLHGLRVAQAGDRARARRGPGRRGGPGGGLRHPGGRPRHAVRIHRGPPRHHPGRDLAVRRAQDRRVRRPRAVPHRRALRSGRGRARSGWSARRCRKRTWTTAVEARVGELLAGRAARGGGSQGASSARWPGGASKTCSATRSSASRTSASRPRARRA